MYIYDLSYFWVTIAMIPRPELFPTMPIGLWGETEVANCLLFWKKLYWIRLYLRRLCMSHWHRWCYYHPGHCFDSFSSWWGRLSLVVRGWLHLRRSDLFMWWIRFFLSRMSVRLFDSYFDFYDYKLIQIMDDLGLSL